MAVKTKHSFGDAYELAVITDAIQTQVFRVVDEYGMPRPKVHVTYKVERWSYVVRLVFAMSWEYTWETDATTAEEMPASMFDEFAESWAVDDNVPIAEPL